SIKPLSPWSRWDPEGYQFIPSITRTTFPSVLNRQYDSPSAGGIAGSAYTTVVQPIQGTLQSQRISPNQSNIVNCYYGFDNTLERTVLSCYKDLGCCSKGCCEDASWNVKYGFTAFVIWFAIWLINRSKDKKMREEIEYHSDQSNNPQVGSQMNVSSPYISQSYVSPVLNQPYYDQQHDMVNNPPYHYDNMGEQKYYNY
uniref:CX domain-containing protein n=1 Tax=Strongyloides stercoralis TaxID=6248 RepID=A0AAF5DN73_STRER